MTRLRHNAHFHPRYFARKGSENPSPGTRILVFRSRNIGDGDESRSTGRGDIDSPYRMDRFSLSLRRIQSAICVRETWRERLFRAFQALEALWLRITQFRGWRKRIVAIVFAQAYGSTELIKARRNRGGVEFHLEWKRYVKRFHLSLPVVDNSVCRGNFFFFLPFFLFYSRRLVRRRGGEGGRSGAVGVILEYRA